VTYVTAVAVALNGGGGFADYGIVFAGGGGGFVDSGIRLAYGCGIFGEGCASCEDDDG
jgi:hypothetical protein